MKHELKSKPEPFTAVWEGVKTAEVRRNDRDFKVGDQIHLIEVHEQCDAYDNTYTVETGRRIYIDVLHIQTGYGLPKGLVVISFKRTGYGYVTDGQVNYFRIPG